MRSVLNDATSDELARTGNEQSGTKPSALTATSESVRWAQLAHKRSVALRHDRTAFAAYLMSEARAFEPGHAADDWLAAQQRIDAIDSGLALP